MLRLFIGRWSQSIRPVPRKSPSAARTSKGSLRQFVPRLELLEDRTVLSTLIVTNANDSGPGSLRDTLGSANNGDTITFASNLAGQTIALTSGQLVVSTNVDIEGLGASQLAVSGSGLSRVFAVNNGVTATIAQLKIAGGRATQGGGIDNLGNLTLQAASITANEALGDSITGNEGGGILNEPGAILMVNQSAFELNLAAFQRGTGGGGLMNLGTATLMNTTFKRNRAGFLGGAIDSEHDSSLALTNCSFLANKADLGGAIWNRGEFGVGVSTLPVSDCQFLGNTAHYAGAIHNDFAGVLTIDGSTFVDNHAGIDGGAIENQFGPSVVVTNSLFKDNSSIVGGAISTGNEAPIGPQTVTLLNCTFTRNLAIGGQAPNLTAKGGAIEADGDGATIVIANCAFSDNLALGGVGKSGLLRNGGGGFGGAVNLEGFPTSLSVIISSTSFVNNFARGGRGGDNGNGGVGAGGGINVEQFCNLVVTNCTLTSNGAVGGRGGTGGNGGNAFGGGIATEVGNFGAPTVTIFGTLLARNGALGGTGGSNGNGGNGFGGGLYISSTSSLCLTGSTVTGNQAQGGAGGSGGNGGQGIGGGIYIDPAAMAAIVDSTVTGNHASTSNDDIFGNYSTTC